MEYELYNELPGKVACTVWNSFRYVMLKILFDIHDHRSAEFWFCQDESYLLEGKVTSAQVN
jgi:hypothetical protein